MSDRPWPTLGDDIQGGDLRQWAITLTERYMLCECEDNHCLAVSTAEAFRAIGEVGVVIGLVDLAAHLVQSMSERPDGLEIGDLLTALRVNADG